MEFRWTANRRRACRRRSSKPTSEHGCKKKLGSDRRRVKDGGATAQRMWASRSRGRFGRNDDLTEQDGSESSPMIRSSGRLGSGRARKRNLARTAQTRAGAADRRLSRMERIVPGRRGQVAHDQTIQLIPVERLIAFGTDEMATSRMSATRRNVAQSNNNSTRTAAPERAKCLPVATLISSSTERLLI